jgi:hypothetical protein
VGRRVFKFDEGQYGPAVSDGERLYVLGGSELLALKPIKISKSYEAKKGTKGIVPPKERRRIRAKEKGGGNASSDSGDGAAGNGDAGQAGNGKKSGGKKRTGKKRSAGSAKKKKKGKKQAKKAGG